MSFERLFDPRGVAIIGASADLTRIGGHPLRALRAAGFRGGIFPVNPKYGEIAGLGCYPAVTAIDAPCDLAIVAVPAAAVPAAILDCGRAGIAFAIVLTAGFRETGEGGAKLEDELKQAIAASGVRVIGPNCQGMLSIPSRVWAVFGSVAEETDLRSGSVSCAFQSGGFGYAIVNLAESQGVGFRHCVSTGNETDVTMPELLSAMLDDPGTSMVFGYLEGTPDGRRLLDLGRKSLETGKPVLLWKGANTESGVRAAASHTANMTGRYDLYRAAFRQSGILEVDDVEPIVDFAKVHAQGRLSEGRNIGVLSISGGSGIVFADRALREGLQLPDFSADTLSRLRRIIPAFGSVQNPADVTAGVFNDITLLTDTIGAVLDDPEIHQLAILLASIPGVPAARAAEAIVSAASKTRKPIHVAWSGRRAKSKEAYDILEAARVPVVPTPVRLAQAAAKLARFSEGRRRLLPRKLPAAVRPGRLQLPRHSGALNEVESKDLLRAFDIAVTEDVLVAPGQDAAVLTANLRPPYAVKIVSRDIPHKTEMGGVELGVPKSRLPEAVRAVEANTLLAAPDARLDGVLVSEMARGVEIIVGVLNDPVFGPAVALGMGGALTEIIQDVTHRLAPFDFETALEMIDELHGSRLLRGFRAAPPSDIDALADALVRISVMAMALKDQLAELDVNPIFVGPRGGGVLVADALALLK